MVFNSLDFAVFLPIVFGLYWAFDRWGTRAQNLLLLVASYVFYGWWDPRFLSLLAFSSLVDYFVGIGLSRTDDPKGRKALIGLSLVVNLGLLGFFKYFNFFAESFAEAFTLMGHYIRPESLDIVLPVGISFYTFQTLSYSIDVYRGHLTPSRNVVDFLAFVSFFPQLVAGPIERASNLLPQFAKRREFNLQLATDGMRQLLWGLFKKTVIADNCAEFANYIFNSPDYFQGGTMAFAAMLFAFQIYGDFSGYSDMAVGMSKLFGFNLMRNFAYPYFSRDMAEFWRRWHISLSTWFRDYLYIPLGGSRGGKWSAVRNTFVIFLVSGFWHGANWTFLMWGLLNAFYFIPLLLLGWNRNNTGNVAPGRIFPDIKDLISIAVTFALTCFAWIFFRAESMADAWHFIHRMIFPMHPKLWVLEAYNFIYWYEVWFVPLVVVFVVAEWIGREKQHPLEGLSWPRPLRWLVYLALLVVIATCSGKVQEFIYFQF